MTKSPPAGDLQPQQRSTPEACKVEAKPEFAKRLAAMEVVDKLADLLGPKTNVPDYVEQEMDSFVASLRKVLHSRKISVDINHQIRQELGAAIQSHLEAIANVTVKATYSAEGLKFSSGQSAPYSRPFGLLVAAGIATRDRINNAGSGAKGETEAPSLSALDVVGGDGLLHQEPNWEVARIARSQLVEIRAIEHGGVSEHACCQLLELMRSDS
ncbi:MAG: hypothetical protein QOE58_143 [Actinomycetota bacterium]|jgi:hypothetical protein|nr:hypothetical protein [Actinomycetota bacterium]